MLHGREEVLVETHRLIVAPGRVGGLGFEALTLDDRVDELRVAGGQFEPAHVEVPLLDDTRLRPVLAHQR